MNLFKKVVSKKSTPPKKAATTTEAKITINVYLMVGLNPSQSTLFISVLISFKNWAAFLILV